jgi:peptidoglycan/xylan/chitin deacetylase (PgdA/CDA1 family)
MADVLVLCYHAVSETWRASQSVPPEDLERQLRLLLRRGYRGTTFSAAVLGAADRQKTLAVTFDDGYRSVLERALPILGELGLPGTVFVPTDHVGSETPMVWPGMEHWRGTSHEAELTPMGWDELARLQGAGWEVGSHSRSHAKLTSLDDEALRSELLDSRRACTERLGTSCTSLAYPYGAYDERVVDAARQAGYSAAGGIPVRFNRPQPLEWPRVGIYHRDAEWRWHYLIKVSPLGRRIRRSPLWHAAAQLRRPIRALERWR